MHEVTVCKEDRGALYAIYVDGIFVEGGLPLDCAEQFAAEIRVVSAYDEFLTRIEERAQKQQMN